MITAHWPSKLVFGAGLMIFFLAGYYLAPLYSAAQPIEVPQLAIDRLIPFVPEAAWLYMLQVIATPALGWMMSTSRDLVAYFVSHLVLISLSLLCFHIVPTVFTRQVTDTGNHSLYMAIVGIDSTFNAFPSLHAGFAVLFAGSFRDITSGFRNAKLWAALAVATAASAGVSALLIKQHVLLDIICGAAVGWFSLSVFTMIRNTRSA